jgi:RNA polymerase-binding transcription factor DksA
VHQMNPEFETRFKMALESRHQELQHRFACADEEARSGERAPEMIDQAVTGYSKEMSLSQSVREHDLLRMIEESLARLAGGNFGLCLPCSSEVSIARLKAVPLDPLLHRVSNKTGRAKWFVTFGDLPKVSFSEGVYSLSRQRMRSGFACLRILRIASSQR